MEPNGCQTGGVIAPTLDSAMSSKRKHHFESRPPEPLQLMALLQEIFPGFGDDNEIQEIQDAEQHGLHCVMRIFSFYFGAKRL
ncbi:MAG: hypothetical protein JO163_21260, partial [Methylobacteriaceae bacterium]|nr:hypothetical protein [Methylobacteriaceae bacterium]